MHTLPLLLIPGEFGGPSLAAQDIQRGIALTASHTSSGKCFRCGLSFGNRLGGVCIGNRVAANQCFKHGTRSSKPLVHLSAFRTQGTNTPHQFIGFQGKRGLLMLNALDHLLAAIALVLSIDDAAPNIREAVFHLAVAKARFIGTRKQNSGFALQQFHLNGQDRQALGQLRQLSAPSQ